jgi:heat shock protein HslJ
MAFYVYNLPPVLKIKTKENTQLKRLLIFISIAIFALILAACGSEPPVPQPAPTQLVERTTPTAAPSYDLNDLYEISWTLVSYGDPANSTVMPSTLVITALFEPDGSLSGSAGCNQYAASYNAAPDGSMEISPQLAVSLMMCETEQMEAEDHYLTALQFVQRFSFSPDGNLTLTYALDEGTEGA